mgnify:CR=1 FL=1
MKHDIYNPKCERPKGLGRTFSIPKATMLLTWKIKAVSDIGKYPWTRAGIKTRSIPKMTPKQR